MTENTGKCFTERQIAFHEVILDCMRKNPGVFPCIPEPELGRVMEEVDLNSTRFECCLPGRAVRFAGTVEKRGDTTYHAMLKSVEVDGKNVLSDFRT